MKKILIIGTVGSGKTTLAKQLSDQMNITWYELDSIVYYKTVNEKYKRTPEQQIEVLQNIDKNSSWIMEGVDRESYRCLFDMADTILFLDTPIWKRKVRIFTRFLRQNLFIEKCEYTPNFHMLKMMYVWTQEFENEREQFEMSLQQYKHKVITLKDNRNFNT